MSDHDRAVRGLLEAAQGRVGGRWVHDGGKKTIDRNGDPAITNLRQPSRMGTVVH